MNYNNKIVLGIALTIVITNGLIGHFFAPLGILLTPLILILTTLLVCMGTENIKSTFISVLTYFFVALNDILIKIYSGGIHDNEGLAWIHFYFFIGLVPTFGILLATVFIRNKEETFLTKITAVFLFIALIAIHLQLFQGKF